MPYTVPQALIFQELNNIPQADIRQQPAHISGGHAQLLRYDDADEKADGQLGYYEPTLDTCYDWPNRPAGGIVDSDYTKVYMDDALLRYFEDFIGAGDTITTVATEKNQVRAAATIWQTANGSSRSAALKERDVAIGDIAKVRAVVGPDTYTLWTYVSGFVAEVIAAVTADATSDADNATTQGAPTPTNTYTGPDALVNCVDISAVDQTSYDGLEDGNINETYTITVVAGSAGGDATTATLSVTSASGDDDDSAVTPAAFGAATAIGANGLLVTFDDTDTAACSLSADNNALSDVDFIPGQQWQVTCGQAFTAPAATSAGAFTGATDATYVIEVTKGGLYANTPQITVTTNTGVDASGPTNITAAATAVAVGTQGVTVAFDAAGLSKGDRYLIVATAASDGAIQTLKLGHNFDEAVQDNGATEVDLTLYIKKDIEVSEQRANVPGQANWTQTATQVCLEDGVTALDSTWTDSGVPEPLPVISESSQQYGLLFVEARYWLNTLCSGIESIYNVSQLDAAISGSLHPDNPLKWGVSKALANSNGVPVAYTSVCDPNDPDEWLTVLELIDGRDDVYGLVPLTRNKTVLDAYLAHVTGQSSAEFGRWRVLWTNQAGIATKAVVDSTTSLDGATVLATLEDDPDTTGTQYTVLEVPAGNGDFVVNSVRAGDVLRYLYTTDGFGGTVYSEFVIDAVLNENTLRLVAPGHTAAVNTAQKIEVHRNLTATEQASELALTNGFSDRRVMSVWPDTIGSGGITFEGYHLCAALAGLASGVPPHAALTNVDISGFDDLTRTVDVFNRTQLNTMAAGGVWIVTQDLQTGAVHTRHAVTTGDTDDLNEREESITRNLDNISYYMLDLFSPYIGVSNVTSELLTVLRSELLSGIQALRSRNFTQRLGAQLTDGTITRLGAHSTLKDRVVIVTNLDLPNALNNLEQHLVV